jgi:hypothetical protein
MARVIRCTCSHCQRDVFFNPRAVSLESLSTLICRECGESGVVITLNVEPPPGAELLEPPPKSEHQTWTV